MATLEITHMKKTIEYDMSELRKGKCKSCGKRALIIIDEDICTDCKFDNEFYEESMKGLDS